VFAEHPKTFAQCDHGKSILHSIGEFGQYKKAKGGKIYLILVGEVTELAEGARLEIVP
jgi:hypothetical protein